jgi:hypothetical protein
MIDPFALSSLIALMMEAARTSETSVNIQLRTWQYIPEDSELHTRRRENLKSHIVNLYGEATLYFSPIALMMAAARTSETSVNFQLRTRQYIPEDSELHTRRRENLKSLTQHISS